MLIISLLAVQSQNQPRLKTHGMTVKAVIISAMTANAAIINAVIIIDAIATAIAIPVATTIAISKIACAAALASNRKTTVSQQRIHKPAASVKRTANAARVATLSAVQL